MAQAIDAALAAQRAGDFATAEREYLKLMHIRNAAQNLGVLYAEHGRPAQAEKVFRWLLAHRPGHAPTSHALGMLLLGERRYEEGWPLYEANRRLVFPPAVAPQADYPEWRGEPLDGRRIVVCAEQGVGDQIMYGRYLPELRRRGAGVVVACDPYTLARFFEAAGLRTSPFTAALPRLPPADFWASMASLPRWLGGGPPPAPAYVERPVTTGGGVGVVTRGNPAQGNDANRSLPPAAAERLRGLGRDLLPPATGARDFQDTADIVASLDLVISVCTSVAHLAGAMGKPLWVLVPRLGMDWRWNDGVSSDWYPQARLFRPPAPGDWGSVLDEVEAALAAG